MSENEIEHLRQLLARAPGNMLLRVGLIRRLVALEEHAEALSLALELDLSVVKATSDRRILGALFKRAGLIEQAEKLNDDRLSMLDDEPEQAIDYPRVAAQQ